MAKILALVLFGLAAVSGLSYDHVVQNLAGDGPRFQYVVDSDGTPHLADLWVKISDYQLTADYDPDTQNVYHLFTRDNPNWSQPFVPGMSKEQIAATNFDPSKLTVFVIHGWTGNATSLINIEVVHAWLLRQDVNMMVVDWSSGADTPTLGYPAAVLNTVTSGKSVARFIQWLIDTTDGSVSRYAIVGHSLGGQMSGIIGRNLNGSVPYVVALDPAYPGWGILNSESFRSTDGEYTEAIHTNAGVLGTVESVADVDFYPNGGVDQPGCLAIDPSCSHGRVTSLFAETLASGGFTGRSCLTYATAMLGVCPPPNRLLQMGGIRPKTGATGIYYLQTNGSPPFSRG